ncbi:MAG TPA: UDP-N-acetylmuramoyl-L-alanyl-D-glutamate--2,6-diaminopimelate ligase [Actinomycetes bacterium]
MPNPSGASWPRPAGLPPRPLSEVAGRLGSAVHGPAAAGIAVTGVTLDSRSVRPGDLYAAVAGATVHGADFAAAAAAAGAVACLTDEAGAARCQAAGLPTLVVPAPRAVLGSLSAWVYGEPAEALTMLGITGTNGKTTTAYLLESGLRGAGYPTGLIGTIETRIGDEVLPSERTTPEAPELQALLAVMRERGVTAVAMEVSSHALAMGRVDGTVYDVAGFTNLSEDHLDFHADLEEYFQVKASLFTPLRSRQAVVDVDDDHGRRLVDLATVRVTTLSPAGRPADWRVEDVVAGPDGSTFVLQSPDGTRVPCSTALAGDFNLANAALAVAMLVTAGLPAQEAAAGVAACPGVPGRMERVPVEGGPVALVDYAHSPDALERLLVTARGLAGDGRLVLVVGCGGDRDRHKRPAMGAIAARGADVVVLTSDNPRAEDPAAILVAVHQGAEQARADGARGEVLVEVDRRSAIRTAVGLAGPSDVVVVAGKGHEQGQETNGVVTPFDDRVELRAALQAARS